MYTNIIALVLAAAPTTPTDRASFDVSDAELVLVDNAAHLVTFDADGEQTATLTVWLDDAGRTHLDADFADGLYMSATVEGESVTIDSPDPAEVAARAAIIGTVLPEVTDAEAMECGLGIVGLVAGATGGPWGVMAGVAGFALTCVKTAVEELQGEDEEE